MRQIKLYSNVDYSRGVLLLCSLQQVFLLCREYCYLRPFLVVFASSSSSSHHVLLSISRLCWCALLKLTQKKHLKQNSLILVAFTQKLFQIKNNIKSRNLVEALALTKILQQIKTSISKMFFKRYIKDRLIEALMEINLNVKKNINRCRVCWRNSCSYS